MKYLFIQNHEHKDDEKQNKTNKKRK